MKKRIAIVLTLILATGTFTACTAEEKVNEDNKTSVVSTADVSSSTESSEPLPTENVTEITTTEKAIVLPNEEPTETDTQTEEKADSGQNLGNKTQSKQTVEVRTNTKNIAKDSTSKVIENQEFKTENIPEQKPVQNVTEPPTQKPTIKPTEKPTQPPTEAKTIDIQYVVSSCISYGKQLGMNYDSTLNTSNASWFSPTNAEYYSDTQSLLNDCYNDVEYTAYFHQDSGIEPSDLTFNVIAEQNKIYIIYC
ncbi:hypothetical protein [Ruminococcus sp. YE282]|uniref:hypothetical protein n=1 Tax=Ruminococcus sp. YE282 TaxID=3158780 RepID=UPI0008833EC8|nr:hypothetical protein SAMN02910441_01925 [Ruminococcus bromii]